MSLVILCVKELLQGAPERTKCDMRKGGGRGAAEHPANSDAVPEGK